MGSLLPNDAVPIPEEWIPPFFFKDLNPTSGLDIVIIILFV
jgi:hypothetical protein